jgi:enterochelin esterase-like enzyme
LLAAAAGAVIAGAERAAHAAAGGGNPDLELRDLRVDGDRALGRRFVLLVPRQQPPGAGLPMLVLLHGLAETRDERLGAHAWVERYGLLEADARLRHPPVARTSRRGDFPEERVAAVNAALAARPYGGLVLCCPYTPNVWKAARPAAALDGYTRWLAEVVLPRARAESGASAGAAATGLDGCSLGGYVGLQVFLRRPDLFGTWGGVQSALSSGAAAGYAARLQRVVKEQGPRPLHLLTSSRDPFRAANQRLADELGRHGVPHQLRVLPGPHDQPWLRESGTLEMLLWHSQHLGLPRQAR